MFSKLSILIITDTIFQNYKNSNEERDPINRTHGYIEQAFQSGATTCLICISKIKRDNPVSPKSKLVFILSILSKCILVYLHIINLCNSIKKHYMTYLFIKGQDSC